MRIKNGDLLKIQLENGEIGYAEKVGNIEQHTCNDKYEVYFITQIGNTEIYKYEEDYDVIEKETILRHVRTKSGDYKIAWMKMGFEMEYHNDGHIIFKKCRNFEENEDISVESLDYSTSESEDLSSVDSLTDTDDDEYDNSFIDDDPQTNCENDCQCEECMKIKNENDNFDKWFPQDNLGKRIKSVINKIERRIKIEIDNENF